MSLTRGPAREAFPALSPSSGEAPTRVMMVLECLGRGERSDIDQQNEVGTIEEGSCS